MLGLAVVGVDDEVDEIGSDGDWLAVDAILPSIRSLDCTSLSATLVTFFLRFASFRHGSQRLYSIGSCVMEMLHFEQNRGSMSATGAVTMDSSEEQEDDEANNGADAVDEDDEDDVGIAATLVEEEDEATDEVSRDG